MTCYGRNWRSLVCLLDTFMHETLHVPLAVMTPVCRWHDWMLARNFDKMLDHGEPVELNVQRPPKVDMTIVSGRQFLSTLTTTGNTGAVTWTKGP